MWKHIEASWTKEGSPWLLSPPEADVLSAGFPRFFGAPLKSVDEVLLRYELESRGRVFLCTLEPKE